MDEFADFLRRQNQLPPPADEFAEFVSRQKAAAPEPSWGDTLIPMGMRIIPAIAGGVVGALGGPVGAAAGGAAGAGFGETLAETYEQRAGLRPEGLNPTQIAMQTGIGAIPIPGSGAGLKGLLSAGAKGAGLGAVADVGTRWAEGGEITPGTVAQGAGLGALFGAGTHGVMGGLQRLMGGRPAPGVPEAPVVRAEPVSDQPYGPSVPGAAETTLADLLRADAAMPAAAGQRRTVPTAPPRESTWNPPATELDANAGRRGSFEAYLQRDAQVSAAAKAERDAQWAAEAAAARDRVTAPPEEWPVRQDPFAEYAPLSEREQIRMQGLQIIESLSEKSGKGPLTPVQKSELDALEVRHYPGMRPQPPPPVAAPVSSAERAQRLLADTLGLKPRESRVPFKVPSAAADALAVSDVPAQEAAAEAARQASVEAAQKELSGTLGETPEAAARRNEAQVVADREQLAHMEGIFANEPPNWVEGETPLQPLFDRAREIAAKPNWSNADIRNGMKRALAGQDNIYARAGVEASREMMPPPRGPAAPETGGGMPSHSEVVAELDAMEAARKEAAFFEDTPNPTPLVDTSPDPADVLGVHATYGRAKADAARLTAEGRPARVAAGNDPTRFEVVKDGPAPESIRDVPEPALIPDVANGPDVPMPPVATLPTQPLMARLRLDELDAAGAKDIEYRSILSTGAKDALKKGDTWRGRAERFVKFEERGRPSKAPEREPGTTASVPMMITKGMERDLRARGVTSQQINAMKPEEAWSILNEREPGQEGFAVPRVMSTMGGGLAGMLYGGTQGDTPEERLKYAALYGMLGAGAGAGAPSLARLLKGTGGMAGSGERGSIPIGGGEKFGKRTEPLSLQKKRVQEAIGYPPEVAAIDDPLERSVAKMKVRSDRGHFDQGKVLVRQRSADAEINRIADMPSNEERTAPKLKGGSETGAVAPGALKALTTGSGALVGEPMPAPKKTIVHNCAKRSESDRK